VSNGSKATIPLGQIAEIDMGTSPPGTSYNKEGIGVPLINGPTEFTDNSPVPQQWTTEPTRVCRKGDILICVRGASTGRMNTADREYCIGRGVAAIRDREDPLATPLLRYVIEHQLPSLLRFGTGSTFVAVDKKAISNIPVPAFDARQRREAARLLNRSEEVELLLSRIITAKRKFQRGLMQELLTGRRRFPEFQHDPRPTVALREVTIINPDTLPESTDDYFRFHYIDISSVSDGRVTIPVSAIAFRDAPSRARRIVRQYDVLFSTVRPYLKGFAIVEDDRRDLVCSTGFAVLRAATKADAQYLLEVLFSDVVGRQVHARLVGSSFPALNNDDVANIRIPWPSAPERAKISHVLGAIRREIHLLEEMRARFETAKRGLMQKLLTGELTVPVSSEPEPVHA